jgi:hypothetical protein
MTADQMKLLQNGDNKGRAPAMNTLKKWFSDWFKAYDEFAPTVKEGKMSSTGNPMDIDDFELGRKNFDILHVISLEMKELKQEKADQKARKEADDEVGPSLRNQALHRLGSKPAIKKRLVKKNTKSTPPADDDGSGDEEQESQEEESQDEESHVEDSQEEESQRQLDAAPKRLSPAKKDKADRAAKRKRLLQEAEADSQRKRVAEARSQMVLQSALRQIGEGQEQLAQVLGLLVPAIARLAVPLPPPPPPYPHQPHPPTSSSSSLHATVLDALHRQ